jgi:putative ABC transport system permease protein
MLQLLYIAARNLLQHRRRTILLAGAIAVVTALLTVLQGISTGMQETMIRAATTLMTGHVNVGGFFKVTAGQSAPLVTQYHRVMEIIRKEVPDIDFMVARGRGWGKLVSDTASMQVGFAGVDIEHEPGLRKTLHLLAGSLDDLHQAGTVLLFKEQADKLGVKVGDMVTFTATTARGTSNTADVRVIAIAQDIGLMSRFAAFTADETLRKVYQLNNDTTGGIQIYLRDIEQVPAVQSRLRAGLAEAGFDLMEPSPQVFWFKFQAVNRETWTGQKLDVTSWEDEVSFLTWTITALGTLTGFLVGTLLLIIVIGIMNTMWIAIRERTKEIGTLRAIGMRRKAIMLLFLLEAAILSVVGTVLGALLGLLITAAVNLAHITVPLAVQVFLMSDTLWIAVRAGPICSACGVICVVTTAAALYPAYRAAKLRPVTAMHHIG